MITRGERRTARGVSIVGNVLGIIFIFMFIISYMRILHSGYTLTLESLLQRLSQVYSLPIPNLSNMVITANWGVFNFLRDFVNSFTSIMNFAIFFSISAANAVLIVAQILPMFFAL